MVSHCNIRMLWFFEDGEDLDQDEPTSPPDLCVEDDLDLLGSERKQTGRLAWGVYRTYWRAVGGLLAASILTSLLLMQGGPADSSSSSRREPVPVPVRGSVCGGLNSR